MTAYITDHPDDYRSLLYLRDILSMDHIKDSSWYVAFATGYINCLDALSGKRYRNLALQARCLLEEFSYTHNLTDTCSSVDSGFYLSQWKVHDTFTRYGDGDFYTVDTDRLTKNRRYRVTHGISPDGRVYLDSYLHDTPGLVRIESDFYAPGPVKLRIASNLQYHLFINGNKAMENSDRTGRRDMRILLTSGSGIITFTIIAQNRSDGYVSVMTTNPDDIPVACTHVTDSPAGSVTATPIDDYPLSETEHDDSSGLFYRAWYLSTLNSTECFPVYERSLAQAYNPVVDYSYAADLIHIDGNFRWNKTEGWKRLNALRKDYPDFIPARYYSAKRAITNGLYTDAVEELEPVHERAHYAGMLLYLSLLERLSRDAEYAAYAGRIESEYPNSIYHHVINARYWKTRDISNQTASLVRYLDRYRSENAAYDLMTVYTENGHHTDARNAARQYIRNNRYRFSYLYYRSLIDREQYKEASRSLLAYSAINNSPQIQYLLGLARYRQGTSPEMYWQRIQGGQTDWYFPHDYFSYTGGDHTRITGINPENERVASILERFFAGNQIDSLFPYREHGYRIHTNAHAHFGSNELLYIRSHDEVRSFGEYKIPFRNPRILRARVYRRDGSFSESSQLQSHQGDTYVTLNQLEQDTIVHISYESLITTSLYESSIFLTEPVYTADYDQSVGDFYLTVTAPQTKNIRMYHSLPGSHQTEETGHGVVQTLHLKNIPEITEESSNGSRELILPFYQLYESESDSAYTQWLDGTVTPLIEAAANDIESDIVSDIYRRIQAGIQDEPFTTFIPDHPRDTAYFRKGSESDKIFLCRALLAQHDIASVPCLVRNPYRDTDRIDSASSFYGMVLYLPDENEIRWLDFSSRYIDAGIVSQAYDGARAVPVGGAFPVTDTVQSRTRPVESVSFTVDCTDNSYSGSITYSGYAAAVRSYFQDKRYTDEYLSRLLTRYRKNILYTKMSTSGLSEVALPFTITTEGTIPSYSVKARDLLIIQPFLRTTDTRSYLRENSRTQPLFITDSIHTQDTYTIMLPEEYRETGYTDSDSFTYGNANARFTVYKKAGVPYMLATQEVHIPKMRIEPADYSDFHSFAHSISLWEKKTITLQEAKP
ncbi:MAG: tetratricopeptide repeat protein [Spirochaetota bacterium]